MSRLLFAESGLQQLEDGAALARMTDVHRSYRAFKDAELEKEEAEEKMKAAGDELVKAIDGYGELKDLPHPMKDYRAGL
ncbi:hypothetical protein CLV78_105219 [Aliiruegeria haliotis]|uniref:Uncharacterized protein n=1 Tax=Aliiruegeria haliotis TaxID=1280846 RepID=A0A2T0RPP5_9RHOB|nr:hypothetical protein [Aliiruegeria haliotis]PRY23165.1 hypothetical protein CLV78_105219 [Aliiruegeria haliotis]